MKHDPIIHYHIIERPKLPFIVKFICVFSALLCLFVVLYLVVFCGVLGYGL